MEKASEELLLFLPFSSTNTFFLHLPFPIHHIYHRIVYNVIKCSICSAFGSRVVSGKTNGSIVAKGSRFSKVLNFIGNALVIPAIPLPLGITFLPLSDVKQLYNSPTQFV